MSHTRTGAVIPAMAVDDLPPWPALSIPDSIVWIDVESDLVLFSSEDDTYHCLDSTAGLLWRAIAHGEQLGSIVESLRCTHDGTGAIVRDVWAFVDQAVRLGLLVVVEPGR